MTKPQCSDVPGDTVTCRGCGYEWYTRAVDPPCPKCAGRGLIWHSVEGSATARSGTERVEYSWRKRRFRYGGKK